jgi:Flp pilus assembly protein TadG
MMRNQLLILRDERGTSIVEMALAAPLLATFLIGMVDLSRAYSAKLQVEQAAQRTIEMVQRNGFTAGTESTLQTEAQNAAGTGSAATVTSSLECTSSGGSVTTKAYAATCSNGDTYARFVKVTITKTYTPFFRVKWDRTSPSGTWTLHGGAGIRVQ